MSRTRDGAEIWFVEEGPSNRMILSLRSPLVSENDWALERLLRASSIHNERFNLEKWHSSVEALLDWPIRLLEYALGDGVKYGGAAWELEEVGGMIRRANESLLVLRNAGLNEPMNGKLLGGNAKLKSFVERWLGGGVEPAVLMDHLGEATLLVLDVTHNMAISSFFDLPAKTTTLPRSLAPLLKSKDRAILTATLRLILALSTSATASQPLIRPNDPIVPLAVDLSLQLILLTSQEDYQLRALALEVLYECSTEAKEAAVILRRRDVAGVFRILAQGLYEGAEERLMAFELNGQEPAKSLANGAGAGSAVSKGELEMMARQPGPARSIYWISRHFKADPNSHTTQASVWQAYLAAFDPLVREGKGAQLATAIEVINNVSLAFAGSESMTTTDQPPIYIIKGIKIRESVTRSTPSYTPNPTSRPLLPPSSSSNGPPTHTRLFPPLDPSTSTPLGPAFTCSLILRNLARSLVELLAPPPSAEEAADAEGKGKKEQKVREGEMFGLPIPNGWTGVVVPERVEVGVGRVLSEEEGERARVGLAGVETVVLDVVSRGTEQVGEWLGEVLEGIAVLEK